MAYRITDLATKEYKYNPTDKILLHSHNDTIVMTMAEFLDYLIKTPVQGLNTDSNTIFGALSELNKLRSDLKDLSLTDFTRITEEGDKRVTEENDNRIGLG